MRLTDEEFAILLKTTTDALDLWGVSLQEDILIEESAELIKSILKMRRFKFKIKNEDEMVKIQEEYMKLTNNILEECADVFLMLHQTISGYNYMVDGKSVFKTFLMNKIARVKERIKKEKGKI
jgi:hypothetical protein